MINVIIHIGPPKTGTSAIQKWLIDHAHSLLKHGIYYPQHNEDSNGISSGNFLSVFEPFEDDFQFSPSRLNMLLSQAKAENCHTVLLSSEYFFSRLKPVVEAIESVKCIAYVRNPAELHESHYNQSVKRHGNTETIRKTEALPMHTIKVLGEHAQLLGERLVLRAYHEQLFVGSNIVADFVNALALNDDITAAIGDVKRVNSSYCFEALEVKRWFNAYNLGDLGNRLDRTLQAYTEGLTDFTFIDHNQFNDYKRQSVFRINGLYQQVPFENAEALIELVKEQQHKPFFRQTLTAEQCHEVLNFIASQDGDLLKRLAFCVYGQPSVKDTAPFTQCIFDLVPPRQALPSLMDYIVSCLKSKRNTTTREPNVLIDNDTNHKEFRFYTQQLLQSRVNLWAYWNAFRYSR